MRSVFCDLMSTFLTQRLPRGTNGIKWGRNLRCVVQGLGLLGAIWATAKVSGGVPADYAGRPFSDAHHQAGPATIPGLVQCALYDLGGEGVAYHDEDPINHGSGELNQRAEHQRDHASRYLWSFRKEEGVDLSYVKDMADLNHTNRVNPPLNQLCIGWTRDGEWCNYTVKVLEPGLYRIRSLYSYRANTVTLDLNRRPAATCVFPVATDGFHHWNLAEIGTIEFPEAGLQLLTFHCKEGNNYAWFEFEWIGPMRSGREPSLKDAHPATQEGRRGTRVKTD